MSAAARTAVAAASPTPEDRPFPEPLRLRLRKAVLALDYAPCTALLARLLQHIGYGDVRPGRTRLRGYNTPGGGGWDLTAALPAGVGSRRTVIRLKHVPHKHSGPDPKPVHQRCVDELRGACLRAGAAEGLLVTTGTFSQTARRLAAPEDSSKGREGSGVATVRLLDGDELVEQLLAARVGVREGFRFPGKRQLELDDAFFQRLNGKAAPVSEGKVAPVRAGKAASTILKSAAAISRPAPTIHEPTPGPLWLRVTVLIGGNRCGGASGQRSGGAAAGGK